MRFPLKKIKSNFICAEVGVWKGDFSSQILSRNPKILHLIDPWVHQNYKAMWYSIEQEKMDRIYADVLERFQNKTNVSIHKLFSTQVKFPNEYFDWVYIDGDHTYEMVKKDLKFYYALIKKGGFLCGDDYGWTSVDCRKGPKPAVDEFVQQNNLDIELEGNQFVISK